MIFKTHIERLAWEATREKKLALIRSVQQRHPDNLFKRHLKRIVKAVKARFNK